MKSKSKLIRNISIITCCCLMFFQSTTAQAAEVNTVRDIFKLATNNISILASNSANASVSGNGVRLRTSPSTSGTILELMYDNEELSIDFTKSWNESNGTWFYVQRLKTGTWGWVSRDYISFWD